MPTPREPEGSTGSEGSKGPGRDPRQEDVERLNRSLEELEDLVDQVILYADPRYIDESKLETPEGADFARKCREVADYLGTLAVRLGGMLDKAPRTPANGRDEQNARDERTGPNEPDAGDVGDR